MLFRIPDDGLSPNPSNPESPYNVKKLYTQQALQWVTVLGAPDSTSVMFTRTVAQIYLFIVGGHKPALQNEPLHIRGNSLILST
jgi:hypothetical protein